VNTETEGEIAGKMAKPVEKHRAQAATKENLEEWYQRITAAVNPASVPAARLKVFCRSDKKAIRIVQNGDSLHVTIMIITAADGGHLMHTLIIPRKEFPEEFATRAGEFHMASSDTGAHQTEAQGD